MNLRRSSTVCCGTCQNWCGEREITEKENILNNNVQEAVKCDNRGICELKKELKNNNQKCVQYTKWLMLDN